MFTNSRSQNNKLCATSAIFYSALLVSLSAASSVVKPYITPSPGRAAPFRPARSTALLAASMAPEAKLPQGDVPASLKARIRQRAMMFGMSVVLSSLAPVLGEVSLVRSHAVMASRS